LTIWPQKFEFEHPSIHMVKIDVNELAICIQQFSFDGKSVATAEAILTSIRWELHIGQVKEQPRSVWRFVRDLNFIDI